MATRGLELVSPAPLARRSATSPAFQRWLVCVMRVIFSAAARDVAASISWIRLGALSGFFGLLPIFVASARTTDATSGCIFLRHFSGPADNPDCGCFDIYCPADPA